MCELWQILAPCWSRISSVHVDQ